MPTNLIDIGFNFTNKRFEKDRHDVLQRAQASGVTHCIVTGTSIEASKAAVNVCMSIQNSYPGMLSATAGVHPHDADTVNDAIVAELKNLIQQNRQWIVAVGETGLDFNRNFSSQPAQILSFEKHIELAREMALPLFLHERDAHDTQLSILKNLGNNLPEGVIHCFTGTMKALKNYLDLGYYIGITGWICDERRGTELQELVSYIPDDRLLVETDAPYLLPRTLRPKPKNGRNEPAFLAEIVNMVAAQRGQDADEVAGITTSNARRLFHLEPVKNP